MKKKLIVPYDFSEVADNAIHHALVVARDVNAEVHNLHVVSKKDEIKGAKNKLDTAVAAAKKSSHAPDIEMINHVRVGNIFDDIADFAVEIGAELIFMGTHGATGWQHITGSHALKVVTSSPAPFV